MMSRALPKEKIAMNGAMGFELEPNVGYRVAPTPETIPVSGSEKILHKPIAAITNQKGVSSLVGNFIIRPRAFARISNYSGRSCASKHHQWKQFTVMCCIATRAFKILMQGIC